LNLIPVLMARTGRRYGAALDMIVSGAVFFEQTASGFASAELNGTSSPYPNTAITHAARSRCL